MYLYHVIGNREIQFMGEVENQEEAFKIINEYCDKIHFECYYYRYWYATDTTAPEDTLVIDYGSWSNFFHLCKNKKFDILEEKST